MARTKLLLGVVAVVFGLAVAAAPAFAVHKYETPLGHAFAGEARLTHVFRFEKVFVECEAAAVSGELAAPATAVTMVPHYSSCKLGGTLASASVTACAYELLEPIGGPIFEAKMKVVNHGSGSCEITFSQIGCSVTVQSSTSQLSKIRAEDTGVASMWVAFEVKGLKYVHSGTCTGFGTGTDGEYKGSVNIEGMIIN